MNTQSNLSLVRLRRAKQSRYNPLMSLGDPAQLTRRLDAFEVGYLKDAVNIFDLLEQRDDLIRSVVSKRKKAVGRQGWTVLIHFYQNLRCENALDRSERGGSASSKPERLWSSALNPNGIPHVSPGLRGTSYPGLTDRGSTNPERVAASK